MEGTDPGVLSAILSLSTVHLFSLSLFVTGQSRNQLQVKANISLENRLGMIKLSKVTQN